MLMINERFAKISSKKMSQFFFKCSWLGFQHGSMTLIEMVPPTLIHGPFSQNLFESHDQGN